MSSLPSSLESIHEAINSNNPFMIKFVDQHHIWEESFPDVSEINAHVSDAVFDAIDQVSKNKIASIGITITGDKGLGKTQVISRIRHRLQTERKALFIYMGNYGNLDHIKSEFLQTLTSSLKKIGMEGVMQWQELAADMFFDARGDKPCSTKTLADKHFYANVRKNPNFLENSVKKISQKNPELDNPYLIKAILWTLSEDHSSYAIRWLSGQEITESKANELGLPHYKKDDSVTNEQKTFNSTCELLCLIARYNNLVLCFDELDDPSCNLRGETRAVVVSALAKDLRNKINKCVLLMAMYPVTLQHEIKQFGGQGQGLTAAYDRIADQVLDLKYLNSDTSVALVRGWLEDFYVSKELVPPEPLYPFNENEIRNIGKENPTARTLLQWCFDNWKSPSNTAPQIIVNSIQAAFENELQSVSTSIEEYMENSDVVGKALLCAFKELRGKEIEGVRVIDVEWINDVHLHLRIIAEDNGHVVKIGTAAILQTNVSSIGAALRKLINYNRFNFTRGCLVRAKQISKSARAARNHLSKLLNEQGGEWVALLEEHIKPLIAIDLLYAKLDNYELTKAQVDEFVTENRLIVDNALIKEILSDPSGQEPIDLADDDLPIRIPVTTSQGDEIEL